MLHWCCFHGLFEAVRVLLGPVRTAHGARKYLERLEQQKYRLGDVDGPDNLQDLPVTALGAAILSGTVDVVRLVLQAGATTANVTPQHNAITLAAAAGRLEIVQYLSALPGLGLNDWDKGGHTPLMAAVRNRKLGVVQWLLQQPGVDVAVRGDYGTTLLHMACHEPFDPKLTELLLQVPQLDVNAQDDDGHTSIMTALSGRDCGPTVRLLLGAPGIDLKLRSHEGINAVGMAVCNIQDPAGLQALVDHGGILDTAGPYKPGAGSTYLHAAASYCNAYAVEKLLDAGAEVHARDAQGRTPLMLACHSLKQQDISTLTLLIDRGQSDVNAVDNSGQPPIVYAVQICSLATFELLRERGATVDPAARYKDGQTLLHYVAYAPNGASAMIQHIIHLGVDPNARNDAGQTALMTAARDSRGDMMFELAGMPKVDVNAQDAQGCTALMLASGNLFRVRDGALLLLLRDDTDVTLRDQDGDTVPVHTLRHSGFSEPGDILDQFTERAAIDVTARYTHGQTLLHVAAASCCWRFVARLLGSDYPTIDVNARDDDGATPLMRALEAGSITSSGILQHPNVDVKATDNHGRTALTYACAPVQAVGRYRQAVSAGEIDELCS